jgi:hypothetical protein
MIGNGGLDNGNVSLNFLQDFVHKLVCDRFGHRSDFSAKKLRRQKLQKRLDKRPLAKSPRYVGERLSPCFSKGTEFQDFGLNG